jgi:hypothetical protein
MYLKIASSCSLPAANVSTVFGVSNESRGQETNSVKTALYNRVTNL